MTTVVFADLVGSTGMFERLGDEAASRFITQFTTALGQVFGEHGGRVVKLLGDGLFVVFAQEADALAACIGIQKKLQDSPLHPGGTGAPVQVQIGIDSGDVVEIDGDCFGDTVNSAARLADLAGAAQILTTAKVQASLLPAQRASLRSLGPIYLRGRAGASEVYRVEWQTGRDEDATMAAPSVHATRPQAFLQLSFGGQVRRLDAGGEPLSLGRAADASLVLNDPRVSRVHATLQWRGGHFVLVDASSHGTWVYMGNQQDAVLLRRTECYLVGSGQIVPGCALGDASPPVILFSVGG
ncbi:MAG: adenylate/guanylate cyclase domain-containing protein [Polaromonas sp.]|nr:adenylate/guanylate cyclase domain-containing protein [Polaromonas sp.]